MEQEKNLLGGSQKQEIDFIDLISRIPVGVCKFLLDETYTLLYGNECMYDIIGYTPEQFQQELNCEVMRIFLEAESGALKGGLQKIFKEGAQDYSIERRIVRRDGAMVWVIVTGNFTGADGCPAAYGVVVDITDRKQMEEQLRIDEERFRLAFAQTDSTIFDYDIATKVMIHANKSAELYGLSHKTQNVPDFLVQEKIVHPDSAEAYLAMYRQICAGVPTAACVIQAKMVDGQYGWRKITMTNILDHTGKPVRAVGMLEDIDAQIRREQRLLERSQRDPLTGLYNKGATESRVRKLLEGEACSGVLFIIDLDLFKGVNDHYGHLFGDLVLAESARRIAKLCRQRDVVGRIGGDEFLLYLDGALSPDVARRKADEICEAFAHDFCGNGVRAKIACTVGLARCPTDGNSFEILYQKADIALYEAKRSGKNRSCLYHLTMNENAAWIPYSNTHIDEPVAIVSLPV